MDDQSEVTGYRIRKQNLGKTAVCKECAKILSLQTDQFEEIVTSQFASEYCVVCERNISNGSPTDVNIEYPNEIAILIETKFEDRGGRFGGVYPQIDSQAEIEEITDGVKRSRPIKTSHDPVIVTLQPDEQGIAKELEQFGRKLAQRGRIRMQNEKLTKDGEVVGYDFTFFAVQ